MTSLIQRMQGRSELGVALLLLALGVLAIVDAAQIPATPGQRGPVGPAAVPVVVGGLHVDGEAEGGEDVDLSHPSDWRTVLLLAGAFLANVVLIEPAGWPISGAVLFFGSAYALGSRHLIRDVIIAFALSFGTYYLFGQVLGIGLPAGVLGGIL